METKIVKDIVTNESLSKEVIDAVGRDRIIDMSKFLSMIPKYRNKSEHDIVLFSIASILLPFKSSTLSKPSKLNGWYIDISAVDSKIIDLYSKYWDVVIEESLIEFGSVSISECNIDVIGESNDDIDSMFKKNIVVWKLIDVVDVDYNVTRSLRRTLLYGNSNVANSALELIV